MKNIFNSITKLFKKDISPTEYFSYLKGSRHTINIDALQELFNLEKIEMNKMLNNGQKAAADRIMFHIKNIVREQTVINSGFNTYVFREDIDKYIDEISKQPVKIIDIDNFERSIPDEQSEIIKKCRPLFDQLYVVFTDYTGREEQKIKVNKRHKDPIVFGCFCETKKNGYEEYKIWNHRFYYITDWEDEYCDLTLDKFISQMPKNTVKYMVPSLTVESLSTRLEELKKEDNNVKV
jgi:hypothetical protein